MEANATAQQNTQTTTPITPTTEERKWYLEHILTDYYPCATQLYM